LKKEKGYFPDLAPEKVAYVCGPLTELPIGQREEIKLLYSRIGDLCKKVLGERAFVPHEHFDPVQHPNATPRKLDAAIRKQVSGKASVLIVLTFAPSWGGGIEVEIANANKVPVIITRQYTKHNGVSLGRPVSRLLLGNPAVRAVVPFENYEDLLERLKAVIPNVVPRKAGRLQKR